MFHATPPSARGLPSTAAWPVPSGQAWRAATGLLGVFFVTTRVAPAVLNKVVFLLLGVWTLLVMFSARRPRVTLVIAPFGEGRFFLLPNQFWQRRWADMTDVVSEDDARRAAVDLRRRTTAYAEGYVQLVRALGESDAKAVGSPRAAAGR